MNKIKSFGNAGAEKRKMAQPQSFFTCKGRNIIYENVKPQ
jgi:hypothetical protein